MLKVAKSRAIKILVKSTKKSFLRKHRKWKLPKKVSLGRMYLGRRSVYYHEGTFRNVSYQIPDLLKKY